MLKKYLFTILSLAGLIDAIYLTYEHFSNNIPPCSINALFSDCGKVLHSPYATPLGIPLALIGVFHYTLILLFAISIFQFKSKISKYLIVLEATIGFFASVYFVFLQLVIIKAICLYCMVSALISTLLFIFALICFNKERKRITLTIIHFLYRYILKPLLFLVDPEIVHTQMVSFGQRIGSQKIIKTITKFLVYKQEPELKQKIAGINFNLPIGLAAGFDYEARLTQSLSAWGFGFQAVGTITNSAYEGNPKPMLGRLPKSKSLMVNKGFKNLGANTTAAKLKKLRFEIPVGISIGRTNSLNLKTQKESIKDIVSAFKEFEGSGLKNTYYELNISCPNLYGNISFYPPKNLEELLTEIDKLKLKKPLFIKMPIEKTNREVLSMLKVITKHSPSGVIFGNLQKDRNNKALVKSEVKMFKIGNFSGKPTYERSNELIGLAYKNYGKKLIIIGCGGVFSPEDAYEKIKLGASLVQLITGMVFEGPNLIMEINFGLVGLLKKDGFTHISEATGSKNSRSS